MIDPNELSQSKFRNTPKQLVGTSRMVALKHLRVAQADVRALVAEVERLRERACVRHPEMCGCADSGGAP